MLSLNEMLSLGFVSLYILFAAIVIYLAFLHFSSSFEPFHFLGPEVNHAKINNANELILQMTFLRRVSFSLSLRIQCGG